MNDEITLKFAVDDSVAQGLHITFIIEGFFLWFQQQLILLLISFSPF